MLEAHKLFEVEPPTQWNWQKQIGVGGFAKVFLEIITLPGFGTQICAVKKIIKGTSYPGKLYEREIEIISKIKQNEWFVQFFAAHSDARHVYIAMEYMEWGDLGSYIDFRWEEGDAAVVAHQLLSGVQYLHENQITHRDLKPANIFPALQKDGTLRTKIGDFGVSKHIPLDGDTTLRTEVGTLQYMAPEVVDGQYKCIVDCWSIGCIVYRLVAREDLFKTLGDVYKFKYLGPDLALTDWGLFSDNCANLMKKLITVDTDKRLEAAAALGHPWMLRFSGTAIMPNELDIGSTLQPKYTISDKLRTRLAGCKA
ncbi:kinase-like domain-containing protein [Tirmania nivea]|nr:kinase-like domain-containing protein [Tirmania nivea]